METVEKAIDGLAEQIVAEDEARREEELDLHNIAPNRPNWDLKRELDKKMAKLERKTQEAIRVLIRQRLAGQKGDALPDLAASIEAEQRADDEPLSDED